jgi:hypothetical protein
MLSVKSFKRITPLSRTIDNCKDEEDKISYSTINEQEIKEIANNYESVKINEPNNNYHFKLKHKTL